MKRQGFIYGAIILIVANAISKILGAVFKIPLTYILHEDGMGIFNSAFTVYVMGLSFVTAGFPLAVSKGISAAVESGDLKKTVVISKTASVVLTSLGIIGGAVLFFGAEFFACAIKEPAAKLAIMAVAPAVPAVALGTVYKSYFQGTGNMTPTAISQVIESVFRLLLGFVLAAYFCASIEKGAAGAISGIMIGEFIATFILWALYRKNRLSREKCKTEREIYKELFSVAVQLMLASLVANMVSVVEISVIRRSLEGISFTAEQAKNLVKSFGDNFNSVLENGKITSSQANWLYGAYTGYAVTLFHLPTGIISTFCVSIFPYIAGAYSAGNMQKAAEGVKKGLSAILLLAVPSTVILFFLSEELLDVLFKSIASSYLLKILAFSVIPMCINGMYSNALYAAGEIYAAFISSFVGSVVKIFACAFLVRNGNIHIYGVPIAAFFDFMTVMVINLVLIYKKYGSCGIFKITLKLAAGGLLMGLWCFFVLPMCGKNVFSRILITGFSGGIIYVLFLICVNIKKDIYSSIE